MRRTILLLTAVGLLAGPAAAHAPRVVDDGAERILRDLRAGPYAGTPEQAALAFVAEHGGALSDDPAALALIPSRTIPWRGRTVVHLQQTHRGVPVLGAGATIKLGADGTAEWARVQVREDLDVDVTPTLAPGDATLRALAAAPQAEIATAPHLVVIDRGPTGRLAYRVPLFADLPPASWIATVDARSGEVLDVSDLRRFASGYAYPESPAVSNHQEVELAALTGDQDVMSGTFAVVRSTVFEDEEAGLAHLATADLDGDFWYEPEEHSASDPFVEVHTYHHLTVASLWLQDVLGHTFDGAALVTTNYRGSPGGSFDNAYFTNGPLGEVLLVFGQGQVDFAYPGDVVVHEFGHSIIQDRTQMLIDQIVIVDQFGWNTAPGAIHEGIADYFAATRFDDPCLAQYIVYPCMRDLSNENTCPDDLFGEVHYDGLIVGAATWEIHELVGAEAADEMVYAALGLIGQAPTFQGLAEALLEVAGDLADDGAFSPDLVEIIEIQLRDRGMSGCGRSLDVVPGADPLSFDVRHMMGFESFDPDTCEFIRDLDVQFTAPFQFAVTIPDDAADLQSVSLTVGMERLDGEEMLEDDLQYAVYARKGELVTLEIDALEIPYIGDFAIPSPLAFDASFEEEPAVATVSAEALDLAPGDTVYFALLHMNCPGVTLSLSSEITTSPPPDEGDGCQCTAAEPEQGEAAAVATLLALAAVAVRRRRR